MKYNSSVAGMALKATLVNNRIAIIAIVINRINLIGKTLHATLRGTSCENRS